MKIRDKSGGFWLNIIQRRNPEVAFEQNYMPDRNLTNLLGQEIISGIKGAKRHKFMVRHLNGKLVVSKVPNGDYSTGILKRKSPDGTPYEPLSETTLQLRKLAGNNRGPSFILRETSKHIYEGLKILSVNFGKKRSSVSIGWEGENAERAAEHNKGFDYTVRYMNKQNEGRQYKITIPARPFIGISEEVVTTLQQMWRKVAK